MRELLKMNNHVRRCYVNLHAKVGGVDLVYPTQNRLVDAMLVFRRTNFLCPVDNCKFEGKNWKYFRNHYALSKDLKPASNCIRITKDIQQAGNSSSEE